MSDFCDIVWADIWDDVGSMTDRQKYRRAVYAIFILGEDPPDEDDDDDEPRRGARGKIKRPKITKPIPQASLNKLKELRERTMQNPDAPDG